MAKRKIGIVGYGHLGEYLYKRIQDHPDLEIAFVWNRSRDLLRGKLNPEYIIQDLNEIRNKKTDLIVETAHPQISKDYGEFFLQHADYLIGSPTALAASTLETQLRKAAAIYNHAVYIPNGAMWGGEDIQRMADNGTLKGLKITMTKHPQSFKLVGYLKDENDKVVDKKVILYDGPVKDLCPLAPNNVNTMAAAAIAAHTLGFNNVRGCLVADPKLIDFHIVEIEVTGPDSHGNQFTVNTIRRNPSVIGNVTGNATFNSFFSSVLHACGKGSGIHLC